MKRQLEVGLHFTLGVARHEMTVIRDEGVYRHLRFKRPDCTAFYFDLITWPGHLCYTGDMGTFVFTRLEDMFDFFRASGDHHNGINPGYWAEKLVGISRGGFEEWDEERFIAAVNEIRVGWMRNYRDQLTKDQRRELWEAVEDEVLQETDSEHEASHNVYSFFHATGGQQFYFEDFFEYRLKDYTFHYLWCCYALVWAIAQYDKAKEAVSA